MTNEDEGTVDALSDESVIGEIVVIIHDEGIRYSTDFSLPEVVMWLEAAKKVAIDRIFGE